MHKNIPYPFIIVKQLKGSNRYFGRITLVRDERKKGFIWFFIYYRREHPLTSSNYLVIILFSWTSKNYIKY